LLLLPLLLLLQHVAATNDAANSTATTSANISLTDQAFWPVRQR
jgi:hypothetical protein